MSPLFPNKKLEIARKNRNEQKKSSIKILFFNDSSTLYHTTNYRIGPNKYIYLFVTHNQINTLFSTGLYHKILIRDLFLEQIKEANYVKLIETLQKHIKISKWNLYYKDRHKKIMTKSCDSRMIEGALLMSLIDVDTRLNGRAPGHGCGFRASPPVGQTL